MHRNLESEVKPFLSTINSLKEPQLESKKLVIFLGSLRLKVRDCPESCITVLLQYWVGLPSGLTLQVRTDHPPQKEQSQHSQLSQGVWTTESKTTGSTRMKGQHGSYPLELALDKPLLVLTTGLIQVLTTGQARCKSVLQCLHLKK